jgi:hypothetical protein
MLERTDGMTVAQFESILEDMGAEKKQMPPFAGNLQERQALTRYVLQELRK